MNRCVDLGIFDIKMEQNREFVTFTARLMNVKGVPDYHWSSNVGDDHGEYTKKHYAVELPIVTNGNTQTLPHDITVTLEVTDAGETATFTKTFVIEAIK